MKIGIDLKYVRSYRKGGNLGDEMVHRNLLQHVGASDTRNTYRLYLNPHVNPAVLGAQPRSNVCTVKMPFFHTHSALRNTVSLPMELRKHPVDLFHGSASLPLGFRGRSVLTMWEFSPLLFPEYFPRYVNVTRRIAYRRAVKSADHIITGTRFMKQEIVRYFLIPEDKVSVIPLGVEDRFLQSVDAERRAAVRARYHIPDRYILTVGDLYPKKNIRRLIRSFQQLRTRLGLEEELVIVGSPIWKTREIQELDLRHTRFAGYVEDDDLPALYQGATAFVFASLYEGFGIPVLEAMASGLPMALSGNTSFPELAGDGATYFDPESETEIGKAIEQVVSNRTLRDAAARTGPIRVQDFQWSDVVAEYSRIYERVA